MSDSPVNEVNLSKMTAPGSGDLTLEQWRAECRAFEERISASYERQIQMLSDFLEDFRRHKDFMLELWKDIRRCLDEQEQKYAQSSNSKVG